MNNIKLITDSTSDIPLQMADSLNIEVLCIPIAINGRGYFERRDFTPEQFYKILLENKEIPVTARINASEYLECFCRYAKEGYQDQICVTINASGSGTNESAHQARQMFIDQYPQLANSSKIHILDSRSYSFGYGYGVIQAAKMAQTGCNADEILAYLQDWIDSVEIYLACYSLDFAKKSGRIHSASAFVGELLGLRPIIHMVDGDNVVLEKVRGDKNVVPSVCRLGNMSIDRSQPEYIVMKGMDNEPANALADSMAELIGCPPKGIYPLGPSVAINSGPKVVAVVLRGKNRRTQK